jgi:hypothetical protein
MGRVTGRRASGSNRWVFVVVCVLIQSIHGEDMMDGTPPGKAGLRKAENHGREHQTAVQAAVVLLSTDSREGGESRLELRLVTVHE